MVSAGCSQASVDTEDVQNHRGYSQTPDILLSFLGDAIRCSCKHGGWGGFWSRNKTFNVLWGTPSWEKGEGKKRESDNGWQEGKGWAWKLKFAQLNKVKAGGEGGGGEGGGSLFSFFQAMWKEKTERRGGNAGDGLGSQCCCVPVLHSVGTEMPLSDANELSVTSFSLLQMSICLHRVDPAQKTSGQWAAC